MSIVDLEGKALAPGESGKIHKMVEKAGGN
jgi:hypothetical protein